MNEEAPLPSSVISEPENDLPEFYNELQRILAQHEVEQEEVAPSGNSVAANAAAANAAAPAEPRRSTRQELLRARLEAQQKQAQALADAKKEAELRRKAAAEAAERPQGKGREDLKRVPDAIYELAGQNLLPIFLVPNAVLAKDYEKTPGRFGLESLLTKSLTPVCELIYGPGLTHALAESFTPKGRRPYIRSFFEITKANDQCKDVIGDWREQSDPKCWICGVTVAKERGDPECEHKLPMLFALLLTGLFDRRLAGILQSAGLSAQYKALLGNEYAWSHNRCNQIKNDDVFIDFTVAGDKTVTFRTNPVIIKDNLDSVLKHASYAPTAAELWGFIQTGPPPYTGTQPEWIASRIPEVETQLASLLTKLNARRYTTKQLASHFVNGLLDRAIALAPQLVNAYVNDENGPKLDPDQRKALEARLLENLEKTKGGRRRTRHRRANRKRTWRKVYRGGAGNEYEALMIVALSLVKALCLESLMTSAPVSLDTIAQVVEQQLTAYQTATDDLAVEALEKAMKNTPKTINELCYQLVEAVRGNSMVGNTMRGAIEAAVSRRNAEIQRADKATRLAFADVKMDAPQRLVPPSPTSSGPQSPIRSEDVAAKLLEEGASPQTVEQTTGVRTIGKRILGSLKGMRSFLRGAPPPPPPPPVQTQSLGDPGSPPPASPARTEGTPGPSPRFRPQGLLDVLSPFRRKRPARGGYELGPRPDWL